MNWNDPTDRAALAESIGIAEYNEALAEHVKDSTVADIAGHAIRTVGTRFGELYAVGETGQAFRTLNEAETYAYTNPVCIESF